MEMRSPPLARKIFRNTNAMLTIVYAVKIVKVFQKNLAQHPPLSRPWRRIRGLRLGESAAALFGRSEVDFRKALRRVQSSSFISHFIRSRCDVVFCWLQ